MKLTGYSTVWSGIHLFRIGYNMVYSWLCECNEPYSTVDHVVTYVFHDRTPDGVWHPSILSCKLLEVTRETNKHRTNPKSKLTIECGTKPTNRNTRAYLSIHYIHPQQGEMAVISDCCFGGKKWGLEGVAYNYCHASLKWAFMGGYNTSDTMVEIGA